MAKPPEVQKCWICGNDATTREHTTKRSDINRIHGDITQDTPAYMHTNAFVNRKVQSSDSQAFKSKTRMCNACNSGLTQPYDKAWDKLSAWLTSNSGVVILGNYLNADVIFPTETATSLIDVQLYFTKWLATRILDGKIDLSIDTFATVLRKRIAHPRLYLGICRTNQTMGVPITALGDIQGSVHNGRIVGLFSTYILNHLAIAVYYAEHGHFDGQYRDLWHPSRNTIRFEILQLRGK